MSNKINIVIDQGSTFSNNIVISSNNGLTMDLTNYTVSAQIRKWYNSTNAVSFNASINAAASSINLLLDANTSSSMNFGRYVYDVKIINTLTNESIRIEEGIVTITPQVTRT